MAFKTNDKIYKAACIFTIMKKEVVVAIFVLILLVLFIIATKTNLIPVKNPVLVGAAISWKLPDNLCNANTVGKIYYYCASASNADSGGNPGIWAWKRVADWTVKATCLESSPSNAPVKTYVWQVVAAPCTSVCQVCTFTGGTQNIGGKDVSTSATYCSWLSGYHTAPDSVSECTFYGEMSPLGAGNIAEIGKRGMCCLWTAKCVDASKGTGLPLRKCA